jgi:hypothetical protein
VSRNDFLLIAALLVAVIGAVHSYLGETVVFPRLFALPNLPLLRRDRTYTVNVLRYAWHMTSVAWWAGGAILAALWWGRGDLRQTVLMIVASMLLFTGLVILATAGRRHPGWPLFLIAAAAAWYGA